MEAILGSLNQINGVIGSAVFDENDECIAHAIPAPYEPILLSRLMGEVRAALEFLSSLDQAKDWSSFHLWLDEGCLVLRNLERMSLLVVGSASLNLSMLGVGLNVAALKLAKSQPGSTGKSGGVGGSGRPSGSSRVSSLTPVSSGQVRVPNAVGPAVVDALLKLFAKQMGPFAKVALKEEMAKLGVTPYTLVPSQYDDLVGILSSRLSDSGKQKQFVAEARGLISKR